MKKMGMRINLATTTATTNTTYIVTVIVALDQYFTLLVPTSGGARQKPAYVKACTSLAIPSFGHLRGHACKAWPYGAWLTLFQSLS